MSEFTLIDTNKYALKGTNGRFLHMGTATSGLREYMCLLDTLTSQTYIEEISGGHLELIEDDNLFDDLLEFFFERGVLEASNIGIADEVWHSDLGKKKTFDVKPN